MDGDATTLLIYSVLEPESFDGSIPPMTTIRKTNMSSLREEGGEGT